MKVQEFLDREKTYIAVPLVVTVLALIGLNNESALRQIAVSAVGVAIFIAIVSMRPKAVSIMRGAPLTLCALFLTLSAIMVVPLFRNHYDCSMRLFGALAALWLAAPVLLTVSAAYMLVPTANIPIPFVTCGVETVFAWVVVALGVAWQHDGRERTPVDGF